MYFLPHSVGKTCCANSLFVQPRRVRHVCLSRPKVYGPLRRLPRVCARKKKDDSEAGEGNRSDLPAKWFTLSKIELKKELEARNCDTSGLKADLLERLLQNIVENDPEKKAKVSSSELVTLKKAQLSILCTAHGLPTSSAKKEMIRVLREFYGYPQVLSAAEIAARSINKSTTRGELLQMNTSVLQIACRANRLPYSNRKGDNVDALLKFMQNKDSDTQKDATSESSLSSGDKKKSDRSKSKKEQPSDQDLGLSEEQKFALDIVCQMTMTGITHLKKKDMVALLSHTGIETNGTKTQIIAAFKELYAQATLAANQTKPLGVIDKENAEQAASEEAPEEQGEIDAASAYIEEVVEEKDISPSQGKILIGDPLVFLRHFRRLVYNEYGQHLDEKKAPGYSTRNAQEEDVMDKLDDFDDVEVISEEDVQTRLRPAIKSSAELKPKIAEEKRGGGLEPKPKLKVGGRKGNEAIGDPLSTDPRILSTGRTSRRRPPQALPPLLDVNLEDLDIDPNEQEGGLKDEEGTNAKSQSLEGKSFQDGVVVDKDLVASDSDVDVNVMPFENVPKSLSNEEEEVDTQNSQLEDKSELEVQPTSGVEDSKSNRESGELSGVEAGKADLSEKFDLGMPQVNSVRGAEYITGEATGLLGSNFQSPSEDSITQPAVVGRLSDPMVAQSETSRNEEVTGPETTAKLVEEDPEVKAREESQIDPQNDPSAQPKMADIPIEFKSIQADSLLGGVEEAVDVLEEGSKEELGALEQPIPKSYLLDRELMDEGRTLEEDKEYLNEQHAELNRIREEIEKKKEAMMELQKQVDTSVLRQKEGFSQIKNVAKLTKDMVSQRLEWQNKAQEEMEALKMNPEKMEQTKLEKKKLGENIAYLQETCEALDTELQEKDKRAEDLRVAVNSESTSEALLRSGDQPGSPNKDSLSRKDSKSPFIVVMALGLAVVEAVRSLTSSEDREKDA